MRLQTLKQRAQILARAARNRDGERLETLRALTFRLARRLTPFVGVESDGLRYIVSTRETAGVGVTVFATGGFQEGVVRSTLTALARHADIHTLQGLTVLEVGANIGSETVSLLARHGAERVIAIEPSAENARMLRANVALNGLEQRVDVHECALSDVDGTLSLELSGENWGDHRIRVGQPSGPALAAEDRRATVDVPTHRLDSLAASGAIDLDAIDLVWMDVQGHEAHVLAGASGLLAAGVPILTEYWPYGLQRAGGLERFEELVAANFEHVIDLNRGGEPTVLPASRVSELAERHRRHPDPFAADTDLLLV